MNHIKNFFIAVWVMDGAEETPSQAPLTFSWLATVPHYTKREAFLTLFNTLAKHPDYYAKPKMNRSHDFMVTVKTGAYTICMDLLKESEYQEYVKKMESGELVANDLLIRGKEDEEGAKTTTVIVGHSWDDDPNNGIPDFSEFDCVFFLDLGVGNRVTSISTLPVLLCLDVSYLHYDSSLTERVTGADGTAELSFFSFSNKYERWQFQIVKCRIGNLSSDSAIHKNYGYVSEQDARRIVATCVQEKDARREANHQMLEANSSPTAAVIEDLMRHLRK